MSWSIGLDINTVIINEKSKKIISLNPITDIWGLGFPTVIFFTLPKLHVNYLVIWVLTIGIGSRVLLIKNLKNKNIHA